MRLVYTLTEEDVLDFAEHHMEHSPALRRRRRDVRWVIAAAIGTLGLVLTLQFGSVWYALGGAGLAVVWVICSPRLIQRQYRSSTLEMYREGGNRNLFGEHEIAADEAGLHSRGPGGVEARIPWTAIERLESASAFVFIYISAAQAAIVPRRGVSDGDFDAFVSLCRQRSGPVAPPTSPPPKRAAAA